MTDFNEHGLANPTDPQRAPHLDTQTLGGDEGYFHEENAPTHRTDGNAEGQSPETPLVAASRGESPAAAETQAHSTATADTEGFSPDTPLDPNPAPKRAAAKRSRGK